MGVDDEGGDDELLSIRGIFNRPAGAVVAPDDANAQAPAADVDMAVDHAAPVLRAVPPEPVADPVQAFIVQYVRDHPIHSRFRWKDYQLQQLEAAGQAWQPPMRDTPDELKKRIMAWVRSEEYRELQDCQEAESKVQEEGEVQENTV